MANTYLTTTLPYVNADPHIGFALEIVQADAWARFRRQQGDEVFFNFGTDEHGLKIFRKAEEAGISPQKYVDGYAAKFEALKTALNLSYTNFIRTSDPHHLKAAQEFWRRCDQNGDIYKKLYKVKYCVGCELEKTDSELVDGRCPLHPSVELEILEEENYFFRFSKYQDQLLELYKNQTDFVVPANRLKEIENFVKEGLSDFSISRLKSKMPWGVDVPGDPDQVMYVWFDALVNYVSALGWPKDEAKFKTWWPVIQFAGKDNLRQQAAIWQAMLFSAGLFPSKQIFIHGFITVDGQKISKSLGNVISPIELVEKYGTDAVRYFLLAKVHPHEDSDFTYERFEEAFNADLANGLGNLVARIAKLCEKNDVSLKTKTKPQIPPLASEAGYEAHLNQFEFNLAVETVWRAIKELDVRLNQQQPWKLTPAKAKPLLEQHALDLLNIAYALHPLLPDTAAKIEAQFKPGKITGQPPLFPRV
jgi:methionyl-tRNA synthetase